MLKQVNSKHSKNISILVYISLIFFIQSLQKILCIVIKKINNNNNSRDKVEDGIISKTMRCKR